MCAAALYLFAPYQSQPTLLITTRREKQALLQHTHRNASQKIYRSFENLCTRTIISLPLFVWYPYFFPFSGLISILLNLFFSNMSTQPLSLILSMSLMMGCWYRGWASLVSTTRGRLKVTLYSMFYAVFLYPNRLTFVPISLFVLVYSNFRIALPSFESTCISYLSIDVSHCFFVPHPSSSSHPLNYCMLVITFSHVVDWRLSIGIVPCAICSHWEVLVNHEFEITSDSDLVRIAFSVFCFCHTHLMLIRVYLCAQAFTCWS